MEFICLQLVFARFKDDTSYHPYWPAGGNPTNPGYTTWINPNMQTGSNNVENCTHYFKDMSLGVFNVTGAAVSVETPYPMAHYGTAPNMDRHLATMDIDLVSNLKQNYVEPLIKKLSESYFIDENMILDAIKTGSSFNLIHLKTMFKIDVFILKEREYYQKAFERRRKNFISDDPDSIQVYLASAEDVILSKLEWYKEGGSVSETQWKDILGVIKVQGNLLDREYLTMWAQEIGVFDLLSKALIEGEI